MYLANVLARGVVRGAIPIVFYGRVLRPGDTRQHAQLVSAADSDGLGRRGLAIAIADDTFGGTGEVPAADRLRPDVHAPSTHPA